VLVDGQRVAELVANRYRADLETDGLGDGRHSFFLPMRPLDPFTRHEIIVRRPADRAPLGIPAVIWPVRGIDRRARAGLAAVLGEAVRAAASQAEAEALRELLLDQAERLRSTEPRVLPSVRARRARQLCALVIDEQWPRPDHDAGSQAVVSHMRALRKLGWRVEFVAADMNACDARAEALLGASGITCHTAPAVASVEEVLRRHPDRYGLVYLHRIGTAASYAGLVRRHQRLARLVYSVADLHHVRLARQAHIEARPELLASARVLAAQELAAMRQVDTVITHSATEAEWLARQAPDVPVHVVPWSVKPWPKQTPMQRSGVLLVANFAHAPNLDGAVWLTTEVMPRVWAEAPGICLTIAGADLPASVRTRLAESRVRLLGHVPDLAPLYNAARLAVAPLRFGAGLKGKVLEAWAAGVPCAMTPIAAEGFSLSADLAGAVAEDAASLARLIVALHADPARADQLGRAGRALLRGTFNAGRERDALAAAIVAPPPHPVDFVRRTASNQPE
jgi:glycosyltransferase involved in cell wall biosynthesis